MKKPARTIGLLFTVYLISVVPASVPAQKIYSGRVIDCSTKGPVPGAEVMLQGTDIKTTTDNLGHFSFAADIDDTTERPEYEISAYNDGIYWRSDNKIDLTVFDITGQKTGIGGTSLLGSGEIKMTRAATGLYLVLVTGKGFSNLYKMIKSTDVLILGGINSSYSKGPVKKHSGASTLSDTIVIAKDGYYTQKYSYRSDEDAYEVLKLKYDDIDYLENIIRPEAFTMLQGLPLNRTFGEVKSIKIVYSIPDGKIYYSNSAKYTVHYYFCSQVLGYSKSNAVFNREQYSENDNRIYILASVNHFTSSDTYTLEFFAGDELDCYDIETVYRKVAETLFTGDALRFYANATKWGTCDNVPIISSDQLYEGQNYQALNPEANYGYLRKIAMNEMSGAYLGRHDIVLLNGIPLDISVVAGIITTEFQTPLSHINVLSHNRGTPNMALRDGWENPKLNNLLDKLVYLNVTLDSFIIREASLQEAQNFWAQKEPQEPHVLELDTTTAGLIDLASADLSSVNLVGGKAANFAELAKVNVVNYGPLPLPEGYFAIPFHYYCRHIHQYGLDLFIDHMLKDNLFQTDFAYRQQLLGKLQDSIRNSPIDTGLLRMVNERVSALPGFPNIRFRSSTNAEDIEGFNGAGLYDSYTGNLIDPDRSIDKAIKKVWASLWNFRAFEEREYFKIDHGTVAMGILVHRSYPSEAANGVVITKHLYNPYNSAITINVQIGEISVVSPRENYFPDQIIYYTYSDQSIFEYTSHSDVPGMEGKTVLTAEELKVLKDYCMAIHYHYCRLFFECRTLDIEFKVDMVDGARKIYIKQARLY